VARCKAVQQPRVREQVRWRQALPGRPACRAAPPPPHHPPVPPSRQGALSPLGLLEAQRLLAAPGPSPPAPRPQHTPPPCRPPSKAYVVDTGAEQLAALAFHTFHWALVTADGRGYIRVTQYVPPAPPGHQPHQLPAPCMPAVRDAPWPPAAAARPHPRQARYPPTPSPLQVRRLGAQGGLPRGHRPGARRRRPPPAAHQRGVHEAAQRGRLQPAADVRRGRRGADLEELHTLGRAAHGHRLAGAYGGGEGGGGLAVGPCLSPHTPNAPTRTQHAPTTPVR
jgi:hypothetical protein